MNERVKVISRDGVRLVELPSGMTLAEGEWTVRREGTAIVLEPGRHPGGSADALLALLATWEPLDESFPEIDNPLPEPVDLADDDGDEGKQGLSAPQRS